MAVRDAWIGGVGPGLLDLAAGTMTEAREAEPLDTTVRLVTPERVEFIYPLAGPFRRLLAYLLDLLVLVGLYLAGVMISSLLSFGAPGSQGLLFAYLFALVWGYGAACEGIFNGQTVGKKAAGIRVMTTQGIPIVGTQAVIRNLIGTVDGPLPFFYLTSLTSMVLTSRFQRLGDLAAGTMVVVEEGRPRAKLPRLDEGAAGKLLPLLPSRIAAGSGMARALADYVAHRPRFGRELREEVAQPLAGPLRSRYGLPDDAPSDAVLCAFYRRLFQGA